MPGRIAPSALKELLDGRATLALIDVREHGEYNTAHIPGASSVPRRLLEWRMARLVPFGGAQVVVCDDDGLRARLAARTLERMGHTQVDVLDGGLNRWAAEGLPTEWGMNVPSKDFGEMVEVRHDVPTIGAHELDEWIKGGDDLVILDTRTPEEYQRACIPGGRSLPGCELAQHITDVLQERPDAKIVVNCAGRTRSIIGARLLQRMDIPNIVSLRNGTSGWTLAGLELEYGANRTAPPELSDESLARAEEFAKRVAQEDGVRVLSIQELQTLMARAGEETLYLVDVRPEQEFLRGHIPGFWWFPGGQAVQRADDVAAVRNGHIVFSCNGVARSFITASWYRQLGFPNIYAVDGGAAAWAERGLPLETGRSEPEPFGLAEANRWVPEVSPQELLATLSSDRPPLALFVDTSREFAAGHVPGARWLSRSWLEIRIDTNAPDPAAPLVLTDAEGSSALLAAATLSDLGYTSVACLSGGMAAWRSAGLPIEQGLSGVMEPPNDIVPAGTERSYADMIHYLRWEEDLGHKYAN